MGLADISRIFDVEWRFKMFRITNEILRTFCLWTLSYSFEISVKSFQFYFKVIPLNFQLPMSSNHLKRWKSQELLEKKLCVAQKKKKTKSARRNLEYRFFDCYHQKEINNLFKTLLAPKAALITNKRTFHASHLTASDLIDDRSWTISEAEQASTIEVESWVLLNI